MSNLVQADIFFFISSILLTLATVVFVVAIIYVIKILKETRSIMATIRKEVDLISQDIEGMRKDIREEGVSPRKVFSFVAGLFNKRKGRKGR